MAQQIELPETIKGVNLDEKPHRTHQDENTLYSVLHCLPATIFFPDPNSPASSAPLLQRIKISVSENGPNLREAYTNTRRSILLWTRRVSHFRSLLVISVGTITLLTLTGLLIFMLFFLVATINAVVISLLMALAAAGSFLSIFIYWRAIYCSIYYFHCHNLSHCSCSDSHRSIFIYWRAIYCSIYYFHCHNLSHCSCSDSHRLDRIFLDYMDVTRKTVGLAKRSLSATGLALSSYSSSRQSHHQNHHHHHDD